MTFDEVYEELIKFVRYLGQLRANGVWLMDKEEIEGELLEEMVKGYQRYNHLPKNELLAIIRRMMDNRISELAHKYYKTHRSLGNYAKDIEATLDDEMAGDGSKLPGVAQENLQWSSVDVPLECDVVLASKERVEKTLNRLSDTSRRVLETILGDNPYLATQIKLAGQRADFTCKATTGTVRLKPWHVADTLMIDEKVVARAYREIRKTYAGVVAEDV